MKINELILEGLVEMSQIIPSVSSLMADPNENEQQLKSLIHKIKFGDFTGTDIGANITLYDNNSEYIGFDTEKNRIIYRMEYGQYTNPILGNYVVQQWVWADPSYSLNLPTRVFFDLVDNYDAVVCDERQTEPGKKFWINQLHKAFDKNLNIYYINFKTNMLVQLSSVHDIERFNKIYQVWTSHAASKDRVFVISNKQLQVTG